MSMRDVSKTKTQRVTIDATGKNLGRLAVEIADLLRGKNDPSLLNSCLDEWRNVIH